MKVQKLIEILNNLPKDSTIGITCAFDEDVYLRDNFDVVKPNVNEYHFLKVPYSNSNNEFEMCDYYIDWINYEYIDYKILSDK